VQKPAHVLLRLASGEASFNLQQAAPPSTSDERGLLQSVMRQAASSIKTHQLGASFKQLWLAGCGGERQR
jgi:hypothetical protein